MKSNQPKHCKLTKAQQEVMDVLNRSKTLEVGPGLVQPRTADALVRKGLCEYGTTPAWAGRSCFRVIKKKEPENAS